MESEFFNHNLKLREKAINIMQTTTNPAHETLALSILLGLNYGHTTINEAGLANFTDSMERDVLERMMCDFWMALNRHAPGSISPGIIFLPG